MALWSLVTHLSFITAFHSPPVKSNDFLPSNKFTQRQTLPIENVKFGIDASGLHTNSQCPMAISLVWMNELDSSIYATPVIDRISSNGKKHILSPEFRGRLSLLDTDGHAVPGWPLEVTEDVDFHTSPLIGDFNDDGYEDIIWVSVDGEVFIVSGRTNAPSLLFQIPKLRVRKRWYDEDGKKPANVGKPGRNLLQVINPEFKDDFDELFSEPNNPTLHHVPIRSEFVDVDVHCLASPVAVDVNFDGSPELIIAVSYYFDREMYTNHPEKFAHLGADIDLEMYVAGGVVVFDLRRNATVWTGQLDLTTDLTELRAHVYASPTVIDLDNDGDLEVVIGTSLGYIYVLNAHSGEVRAGFPIHMSEIQAQVTVEDINGDGALELIAADVNGNVMCFDKNGIEIWETQVSGFVAQGATFGDVDGDGAIDVVVGTVSGHVWVLRGDTGRSLPGFPLKTDDRILAPITLVNLDTAEQARTRQAEFARKVTGIIFEKKNSSTFSAGLRNVSYSNFGFGSGLHLVFPSFDGHVYIVDGRTGCANKLDISEHAYGMVLADDLLDNGKMSLLVTTQNGNVYCFATESPYHPMKAWNSQAQGVNGFTARQGYHGIFIVDYPTGDVVGHSFDLTFEIVDERSKLKRHNQAVKYVVTIGLSGIDPGAQNSASHITNRQLIFRKIFNRPGRYTERINCPRLPHRAVLHLHMWNEHLQYFQDSVSMSFNVHFYRILKYLVVGPLLVSAGLFMVLYQPNKEDILPYRDHSS